MRRIQKFTGLKALVTGGSSGIGFEVARSLVGKGSKVSIIAMDQAKLDRTREILGDVNVASADVSVHKEVLRAVETLGYGSGFDLLVNCAGIVHPGRFETLEPETIRRTIEVNLLGTINVCQAVLPGMKAGGHIANVSSIAGILGLFGYSSYSASKFGVIGFSEALRMELRPRGIGVSVVLPPDTLTAQLEAEERLKPPETKRLTGTIRPRTPEWVAAGIVDAMARRRFMTVMTLQGKSIHLASRMAPALTRWYLDRKIGL